MNNECKCVHEVKLAEAEKSRDYWVDLAIEDNKRVETLQDELRRLKNVEHSRNLWRETALKYDEELQALKHQYKEGCYWEGRTAEAWHERYLDAHKEVEVLRSELEEAKAKRKAVSDE